jgi:hypothetical protein
MSTWKKVALLNVSGLFGIGLSLFMVPPQTPLWIWASLSVLCLAVFNLFLFRRLRRGIGERNAPPTGPAGSSLPARFSDVGKTVAIIERHKFGGTCVNTGRYPPTGQ